MSPPTLLSINVGLPREVEWHGKVVKTSIFKSPVSGTVRVNRLNLVGDQQSDLTVHGGKNKAVYVYPSEHYPFWRDELPGFPLPWGAFGENLTSEGLLETEIFIGDRLRIGTAEFVVTQPRMPCFKLGIRFDRADMVKRFLQSRRSGFYVKVSQEGEVSTGDEITVVERDGHRVSVTDIVELNVPGNHDWDLLRRASEVEALPRGTRLRFQEMLSGPDAQRTLLDE